MSWLSWRPASRLRFASARPTVAQSAEAAAGLERIRLKADTTTESGRLLVSVFEREEDLLGATVAARTTGLDIIDVFTPYAVHGLDRVMGLRPSRLPWVCFLLGAFGAATMLSFQFWTTAVSWPINVGGKPWNSWPAFVPVTFEVMVLLAGVGTVAAFVWVAGLRPMRQPGLTDLRLTDDRFALVLRQTGDAFDRGAVDAMLSSFHAVAIEERSQEKVS